MLVASDSRQIKYNRLDLTGDLKPTYDWRRRLSRFRKLRLHVAERTTL